MNEVITPEMVLSFDGRVIELFQHGQRGGSQRYHIAHFQSGEVIEGRRDARLSLAFGIGRMLIPFQADYIDPVRAFLAAVQAATRQ